MKRRPSVTILSGQDLEPKTILPPTIRGVFLPSEPKTQEIIRSHTYAFGLDWLEFTATATLNELPIFPENSSFTYEHSGHGAKFYHDVYNVSAYTLGEKLPFCTIQTKPRPSFLSSHLVQIKIDNRFCYTPNLGVLIVQFLEEFKFKFLNFTRVDVFTDFQNINHFGTDIQAFMKACAARTIIMKGKSMIVHHRRNDITGITWGTRASGMACTMYNKTTEMLKKSWKPWIEQLWHHAGFDLEKDVYRLEFSMKKPKADIINRYGETLFSFDDLTMVYAVKPILDFCYHQHFQLAFNKEGERFSRLTRYYMLMLDGTGFYPVLSCVKPKSNNYTKAYIKRLAVDALFYQRKGDRIQSSFIFDHIITIVDRHNLHRWFSQKMYWLDLKKSNVSVFDYNTKQYIIDNLLTQNSILN